jgi:pyruvate formate lyase activating enzyme
MTIGSTLGRAVDRMRGSERGVAPAILAEPQDDGSVRCVLCAHRCLIRPGRRGICMVRENRDGQLVTLVYGEAVSVALDPIEKKPLFHVDPGSTAYSIATWGCNFHCRFCQNWEIAQAGREHIHVPARHLPPEDVVAEARALGAGSIAYTYVEPTIFAEYAVDSARLARAAGIRNVFVSNGYMTPEAVGVLGPLLDAANVDIKGFNDRFYRRYLGATLEPVKESLVLLQQAGVWLEITTLLVPGLNDDATELEALATWVRDALGPETPWHLSRFFPAYRLTDVPPTPLPTLLAAAEIGRRVGLAHVYVGNAPDVGGEDTTCAGCGRLLIARRGFRVARNELVEGACPGCGRRLAGIGLGGPELPRSAEIRRGAEPSPGEPEVT